MNQKIVIPGGAGFVGRNLVEFLIEKGYDPDDIFVIDKDSQRLEKISSMGVNTIKADLSKYGKWAENFSGADIVVNLEAQISSENYSDFKKNNVIATKNVIRAMKENGVDDIIHFSSAAVLSVRKDWYAETKKAGEDLVLKSGLNYFVIRPSVIYGPYDDKNVGWFANLAMKYPFFPIPGNGKYPRQPVYVGDICKIVEKMMRRIPENEIYSINGEVVYFDDMIKEIIKNIGRRAIIYVPLPLFKSLVFLYRKVDRNFKFTLDQLDSLTSGDVFDDFPWWKEFGVKRTKFSDGVRKMFERGIPKVKTVIV